MLLHNVQFILICLPESISASFSLYSKYPKTITAESPQLSHVPSMTLAA